MPFPLAAAIGAGSNLIGSLFNSFSQRSQNRQSQRFALDMYNRQYNDSIRFWEMQNAYNAPAAQMQRYKDAGLNPHLIYGQQNTGGSLSVPDVKTPEFTNPRWGDAINNSGMAMMEGIYNFEMKQAQIDNVKAQNSVLQQDALLRAAQILQTEASTNRSVFDLGLESELRDISVEARKTALSQTKQSMDLAMNRDAREAVLNASNVKEAAERMLNMAEQRLNMRMDRAKTSADIDKVREEMKNLKEQRYVLERQGVLQELEIELRRNNINPSDPMWQRIVGQWLSWFFERFTGTGNILRFR